MNTIIGMLGIVASFWISNHIGSVWEETGLSFIFLALGFLLIPLTFLSVNDDATDILGHNIINFGGRKRGRP